MNNPRTTFEQQPKLNDELESIHKELGAHLAGPAAHVARHDIWQIELETSETGELVGISGIRGGQETYRFARPNESADWQAEGQPRLFSEAHFHNIANIAMRDLEWEAVPVAGN